MKEIGNTTFCNEGMAPYFYKFNLNFFDSFEFEKIISDRKIGNEGLGFLVNLVSLLVSKSKVNNSKFEEVSADFSEHFLKYRLGVTSKKLLKFLNIFENIFHFSYSKTSNIFTIKLNEINMFVLQSNANKQAAYRDRLKNYEKEQQNRKKSVTEKRELRNNTITTTYQDYRELDKQTFEEVSSSFLNNSEAALEVDVLTAELKNEVNVENYLWPVVENPISLVIDSICAKEQCKNQESVCEEYEPLVIEDFVKPEEVKSNVIFERFEPLKKSEFDLMLESHKNFAPLSDNEKVLTKQSMFEYLDRTHKGKTISDHTRIIKSVLDVRKWAINMEVAMIENNAPKASNGGFNALSNRFSNCERDEHGQIIPKLIQEKPLKEQIKISQDNYSYYSSKGKGFESFAMAEKLRIENLERRIAAGEK